MFNVGDRVVYTGKLSNSLGGSVTKQTEGTVVIKSNGNSSANYCYVRFMDFRNKETKYPVYNGDIALAGPAEPEEYEGWFK